LEKSSNKGAKQEIPLTDSASFTVDAADVPALRSAVARLARAGYSETRVRERLGVSDLADLQWRALPIYRAQQLAERDALALAIDLFLLQGVLPSAELSCLFDESQRNGLVRAGLLSIDDQGFARARASLFPSGDSLFFSDHAWPKLPHPGLADVPYDQVMYIGADSRWLARVTSRRPMDAALDLCTGSGIHALLAAPHSKRVLAVDINPRAAACTRFNALASGADNIEVAVGNLYEPVGGERFDLITANPPFVPSPVDSLGFRDGGCSGEEVQRRIVEGLPLHLAPGGMAQIVTELGERDEAPISERLRAWLGDAPIDILILRLREHSAATYAIGHAQGDYDFGEFLDSVHDWSDNLRKQGYTRVVSVLLAFQWSDPASGQPWTRSEETPPPLNDAGHEIESIFLAERTARKADLRETLERSMLRRAGPVGLMEAQVLGSNLRANAQAKLLGKSLSILQWLNPAERELLVLLEEPLKFSDLSGRARGLDLDKETVISAVASLIRRGFLLLTDCR
jgi:hypothetical protein